MRLVDGISKMFRAFNRKITPGDISYKAKDLSVTLARLDNSEIIPFFDYVMGFENALPHDKRLRELSCLWKKGTSQDNAQFGYFTFNGFWVPLEAYQVAHPGAFANVIHQLNMREIEILIKAKHGILSPQNPELESIMARKFRFTKGKYQVHREEWTPEHEAYFEQVQKTIDTKRKFAQTLDENLRKKGAES